MSWRLLTVAAAVRVYELASADHRNASTYELAFADRCHCGPFVCKYSSWPLLTDHAPTRMWLHSSLYVVS